MKRRVLHLEKMSSLVKKRFLQVEGRILHLEKAPSLMKKQPLH